MVKKLDKLNAVFDTETTGLQKVSASNVYYQPQIIEIYIKNI